MLHFKQHPRRLRRGQESAQRGQSGGDTHTHLAVITNARSVASYENEHEGSQRRVYVRPS